MRTQLNLISTQDLSIKLLLQFLGAWATVAQRLEDELLQTNPDVTIVHTVTHAEPSDDPDSECIKCPFMHCRVALEAQTPPDEDIDFEVSGSGPFIFDRDYRIVRDLETIVQTVMAALKARMASA